MTDILKKIYKSLANKRVSLADIDHAISIYPNVFPAPKYLLFAKKCLEAGSKVKMIFAKTTRSKYLYITWRQFCFKVRFSNHPPNAFKEDAGDCDFFVGITNRTITTSDDAWKNMLFFFKSKGWSE